jgi:hypothetical protein
MKGRYFVDVCFFGEFKTKYGKDFLTTLQKSGARERSLFLENEKKVGSIWLGEAGESNAALLGDLVEADYPNAFHQFLGTPWPAVVIEMDVIRHVIKVRYLQNRSKPYCDAWVPQCKVVPKGNVVMMKWHYMQTQLGLTSDYLLFSATRHQDGVQSRS